ncbi:putative pentatricopeptide repeat-containing protein At1g74400 [Neltuma alba]|uniref:putative pentatricopeptide repeat-containing protein At1g74400 n=1 Tax=Neltuma alba TaxID=207710 RepID=UPI0010A52399|nr:putative pentatricopeptide repeat-containing protein At1g74400 [Prosopis alba]
MKTLKVKVCASESPNMLLPSQRDLVQKFQVHFSVARLLHSRPECPSFINIFALLRGPISRFHLLQVHARIYQLGAHQNDWVATRLIGRYPSYVSLRIFHQLQNPNIFPFNAIIRVLADEGQSSHAFSAFKNLNDDLFCLMISPFLSSSRHASRPQMPVSLSKFILKFRRWVCLIIYLLVMDWSQSTPKGFMIWSLHLKCLMKFPDITVVSCWTSLAKGYAESGKSEDVLNLFRVMIEQNIHPENDTMVSVLSACSNFATPTIQKWVAILSELVDNTDPEEICRDSINTVLIYLHGKWGMIETSRDRFDQVSSKGKRSVLPWNAMINAYVQNGLPLEGLTLFRTMVEDQITEPNHVTMVSVLSACAQIGDLDLGVRVHEYMMSNGRKGIIGSNRILATALLDMYSKCGSLDRAKEVFEHAESKDVVLFNAMIMGLAVNSEGENALRLFYKMFEFGIKPNAGTFLGVLCACSHSGLLERGRQIFRDMNMTFKISPNSEHYACYIDLLARGNMLEEALEVVTSMPFKPNNFVWGALLGGCLLHSRVELAQEVSMKLVEADPSNSAGYVMLANAFASNHHWSDVSALRTEMREKEIKKQPGYSWISLDGVVHEFLVGCFHILKLRTYIIHWPSW